MAAVEERLALFFEDDQLPNIWPAGKVSSAQLACSYQWPPVICAAGYVPCLRAWEPTASGRRLKPAQASQVSQVQFTPADSLRELDGHCFTSCIVKDGLLHALTGNTDSKVVVWSTDTWKRLAVLLLPPDDEGACLAATGAHVAVGTLGGDVHVWRRAGDDWQPLFQAPLHLDSMPVHGVAFGAAPDGSELLVVHSRGKNAVGVWRLADGKLVHKMEMKTDGGKDAKAVVAANTQFVFTDGTLLAAVSHLPGHDPVVQLIDVLSREGELMDAPDRLKGRGRPLCADFDGAFLAVGFEDGALVTFGYRGWLRWHRGAVGAVQVLKGRGQIVSGCAHGDVCLWDAEGGLVACVRPGFQVTSLAAGDLFAAIGGNRGELQVAVIPYVEDTEEQMKARGAAGRDKRPTTVLAKYELHYDLRSAKPMPPEVRSPLSGRLEPQHADVLHCFEIPRLPLNAQHFAERDKNRHVEDLQEMLQQQQLNNNSNNTPAGQGGKEGATSNFNAKAALGGAQRTKQEEEAEAEAVKKQQLKQMGEAAGVARSSAKVLLPSSVEHLGRKCDNPTCLARAGTAGATFARCAACRRAWYCSTHCQRTHWRDGHNKQCKEWQAEAAAQAAASAPAAPPAGPAPTAATEPPQQQDAIPGPAPSTKQAAGGGKLAAAAAATDAGGGDGAIKTAADVAPKIDLEDLD